MSEREREREREKEKEKEKEKERNKSATEESEFRIKGFCLFGEKCFHFLLFPLLSVDAKMLIRFVLNLIEVEEGAYVVLTLLLLGRYISKGLLSLFWQGIARCSVVNLIYILQA